MTKVSMLRSDGHGIVGTYANADCHAKVVKPLVQALEPYGEHLGFAEWKQGHNIHVFVANDGRKFTLRAFTKDGNYHGIRLSLRVSRSKEIQLHDITEVDEVSTLADVMHSLSHGLKGDATALMDK